MRSQKSFDKFVLCNTLALISGATPFSLDITVLCPEKVQPSSMYLLMLTFYYDQSMIIHSCGLRRICFSVYGKFVARGAFPAFFDLMAHPNLLPKEICTYHLRPGKAPLGLLTKKLLRTLFLQPTAHAPTSVKGSGDTLANSQ